MRKASKQFTLIELLITMTIAIILFGLAGQNLMKKPAGLRRREAINQLKVCFSDARMLALATNSKTAIKLTDKGQKIEVVKVASQFNPFAQSSRVLAEENNETQTKKERIVAKPISFALPNGCKIEPIDEEIGQDIDHPITMFFFYPEGEATGDSYKLVTGTQSFLIQVDQLTGQLILTENEEF